MFDMPLPTPKATSNPRLAVKRIIASFPTGRKKVYEWTALFLPVGNPELRAANEGGLAGFPASVSERSATQHLP